MSGPARRGRGARSRSTNRGRGSGAADTGALPPGVAARRLAAEALVRIDAEGAYANLAVPALLARHEDDLDERDRGFVTELVYGTTRRRRSCDWLVDRFVLTDLDATARAFLRLGVYQLAFLDTPPHAAVSATVEAAPKRIRGLVNAVLRRVADAPREWPDDGTRLSYPDWIISRLTDDLGSEAAIAALEAMNEPAAVTERPDGYIQDLGSQWVVDAVGARPGERVLDLCAAPGGKATGLAATGASVVAADARPARARLVAANATRTGVDVAVVAADGTRPPFVSGSLDRALVDAPCSGLGTLRRRPDARWRIQPEDVATLAALQLELLLAAAALVRPGGELVYSVCTVTAAETVDVDAALADRLPGFVPLDPPAEPWVPTGRGALLLPQAAGTDGMFLLRLRAAG